MAFISRKFGLQLPAERGKVIISKGYHTKCSSRRDVVLFMSENERNSVHFVRGAIPAVSRRARSVSPASGSSSNGALF